MNPELFREWRSPRFGRANPERINNPVWEWLIESRLDAYSANKQLGGPDPLEAGPCWCFDRFGQSSTVLPDGRVVLIAGEHEDAYDADFCIYNDVVVRHADGRVDIYGYPRELFPPTDFHSATLAGDRIVIIGSLGYRGERRPGVTPVMLLDVSTFAISRAATSGPEPGWLSRHHAELSPDGTSIVVRGGQLIRGVEPPELVENIDDWRLDLSTWRWERLTDRRWARWELRRADRMPIRLWEIGRAVFARDAGWAEDLEAQMVALTAQLGMRPDLDVAAALYRPEVPHDRLPQREEEFGVQRISVGGVVVRYVEDMYAVQLTVEGTLAESTLDRLVSDLRAKLEAIENAPLAVMRL
jgi:hypothetical protein